MRCWSLSALGARGHRSFSCTTPRTTGSMVQSDARRRSGKARRVVWPSWSGRVDRRPLASTRRARAASCSAISGGRLGRTMAREHGHGAQHYPAEPRRSMSLARVPRVAVERLRGALPEPWSRKLATRWRARSCARLSPSQGLSGSRAQRPAECAPLPLWRTSRPTPPTAQQGGSRRSRPAVSDGRDQISVSGSPDRSRCPRAGWPRPSPCRARGSRSRRTRSSGTARPSPLRSARR